MLAATLCQQICFLPGAVLCLTEAERRVAAQREAVKALGLGVPLAVVIIDPQRENFVRAERRWFQDG